MAAALLPDSLWDLVEPLLTDFRGGIDFGRHIGM
jgi:hypothetical protein